MILLSIVFIVCTLSIYAEDMESIRIDQQSSLPCSASKLVLPLQPCKKKHRCTACRQSISSDFCTRCNSCSPRLGNDHSFASCQPVRSIFIPRSQGANTARELVGWQEFLHRCSLGQNYFVFANSLGYSASIDPQRIARYFFGSQDLSFTGSQVSNRSFCDLLADNFNLSTHFIGNLHVEPTISNIFLDNQFFIGLDSYVCGLYLRLHAPIVHTIWNLKAKITDTLEKAQCKPFPSCYMSEEKSEAFCNLGQALCQGSHLEFGRFPFKALTKTALADIDIILGWDFYKNDYSHLGIFGLAVVPTGNKPHSKFIFEPIVGNGKHLELGAGLTGHLILWDEGFDQSLGIYLDANITHMFNSYQFRSFDLCRRGPLSRYMLLKEFILQDTTLVPTGKVINAIDFTTRMVKTSIPVKGDVSVKLSYRSYCVCLDLGYNFYANSEEKIMLCDNILGAQNKFYGIKGTEGVCALEYQTMGEHKPLSFGPFVKQIPLNATQHKATIRHGAKTDNPQPIPVLSNQDIAVTALSRQNGLIVGNDIQKAYASNPPVILEDNDLDIRSGSAARSATHKVFGYIGYTFERCSYIPYIGLGGELELEALACNEQTSLNQWSLWIKGGISF